MKKAALLSLTKLTGKRLNRILFFAGFEKLLISLFL